MSLMAKALTQDAFLQSRLEGDGGGAFRDWFVASSPTVRLTGSNLRAELLHGRRLHLDVELADSGLRTGDRGQRTAVGP